MKSYNYERVGKLLDYINTSKEKIEPLELIAIFLPSLYELNLVYNKTLKGVYHKIRIDMQDKELKGAIRKAYELKNELDYCETMILSYLTRNEKSDKVEEFKKGDLVYNLELGNGEVIQILEHDLMLVKFENKKLNVMCSQKGYTVYDEKKRKVVKR